MQKIGLSLDTCLNLLQIHKLCFMNYVYLLSCPKSFFRFTKKQ